MSSPVLLPHSWLRSAAIIVWLFTGAGCVAEDFDSAEGTLPEDGFPDEVLGTIEPITGYYRASRVELYDLGRIEPARNASGQFAGVHVHPIYVLTNAAGVLREQLAVIDVMPASSGYTPFFQITEARVADPYEPNEIKSQATLLRRGLTLTETANVIHCPLIGQSASVVVGANGEGGALLLDLWYRKRRARCLLLEGGLALVQGGLPATQVDSVAVGGRTTYSVPARNVFIPEVRIFDEEVEVPGNLLSELGPGDAGYSPVALISEVRVSATYQQGSFDERSDVDETLIELRSPEEYRDYPLIGPAE